MGEHTLYVCDIYMYNGLASYPPGLLHGQKEQFSVCVISLGTRLVYVYTCSMNMCMWCR